LDAFATKKEIAHGIVIDKCPKCNGVWLDGGELERLSDDIGAEAMIAVTQTIVMGVH
jgi:Zn-finger nucleic acid-binding protein|tara:strand:- start:2235 stop:2405 length:171 start_codon:yes stop_codon:yes gene_type:complete